MPRRKLDAARKKELIRVLRLRLRRLGKRPLLGILREIGRTFGVSANAVRYHARSIGSSSTPGAGLLQNGVVIRALWRRAREHRRLARVLARRHERLAQKYEAMAASLTSIPS